MKKILFCFISLMLFLAGCGDSNVKKVKDYTFDFDKSMTVGTAIETNKMLEKIKWQDISSDSQKIVQVTAEVKKEIIDRENKEAMNKYNEDTQKYENALEEATKKRDKKIVEFEENRKIKIQNFKDGYAKYIENLIASIMHNYNRGKTDKSPEISRDEILKMAEFYFKDYNVSNSQEKRTKISNNLAEKFFLKKGFFDSPSDYIANSLEELFHLTSEEPEIPEYLMEEAPDYIKDIDAYLPMLKPTEPTKLKNKNYKFIFLINTDNTVVLKRVVVKVNDEEYGFNVDSPISNGYGILAEIYKR